MPLPYTFAGLSTAQMAYLDADFAALGALTPIPTNNTGTNSIALVAVSNTPTISAYLNYQAFVTVSMSSNTGPVTATYSGLATLNVYKDSAAGPVPLAGGEIVAGNLIYLVYDSALNNGNGGFHLITRVPTVSTPLAAVTTVSTTGAVTLSAAAMTGNGTGYGIISRGGSPGSGYSDTTPTATQLLNALSGAIVGSTFQTLLSNASGQTETLLAGSGVTVGGTVTTANGTNHLFRGIFTAVGASPAVTLYG